MHDPEEHRGCIPSSATPVPPCEPSEGPVSQHSVGWAHASSCAGVIFCFDNRKSETRHFPLLFQHYMNGLKEVFWRGKHKGIADNGMVFNNAAVLSKLSSVKPCYKALWKGHWNDADIAWVFDRSSAERWCSSERSLICITWEVGAKKSWMPSLEPYSTPGGFLTLTPDVAPSHMPGRNAFRTVILISSLASHSLLFISHYALT